MKKEEQDRIYDEIVDEYFIKQANKRALKIQLLMEDIIKLDLRGMLIVGSAYIEELCTECFTNTIGRGERKIKYDKTYKRDFTFSLTSYMLWAQEYLCDEIYNLISTIRDVRNKLAHNAIIEQPIHNFISDKAKKINDILQNSSFSFHSGKIAHNFDINELKFNVDETDTLDKQEKNQLLLQTFFVAIVDLMFGLNSLSFWIVPEEKLAKLLINNTTKHIGVSVFYNHFHYETKSYYENKFSAN